MRQSEAAAAAASAGTHNTTYTHNLSTPTTDGRESKSVWERILILNFQSVETSTTLSHHVTTMTAKYCNDLLGSLGFLKDISEDLLQWIYFLIL